MGRECYTPQGSKPRQVSLAAREKSNGEKLEVMKFLGSQVKLWPPCHSEGVMLEPPSESLSVDQLQGHG